MRAAATGRLNLNGVKLGPDALLGGGDPDVYAECIRLGRLGWCALAVGTAQAVLDYVNPVRQRAQRFRRADLQPPGGRLRRLQHRDRAGGHAPDDTQRAASRADQGREFAREAAIARRLCTDKGMKIGSDGVQLLGGHGYVKEHPVERWYRDLRAAGLMEGALLV